MVPEDVMAILTRDGLDMLDAIKVHPQCFGTAINSISKDNITTRAMLLKHCLSFFQDI